MIVSAIANGGKLMKPYLVDKITNYAGTTVKKYMPESYKELMTSSEAAQLTEYMKAVVNYGTGAALSGASYTVAGKPELPRSVKMEIQYIPGLSDFPMWIIRSWRSAFVSRMQIQRPLLVSVSQSRCLILTIIIKGRGDSAHEVLQKSLCQ